MSSTFNSKDSSSFPVRRKLLTSNEDSSMPVKRKFLTEGESVSSSNVKHNVLTTKTSGSISIKQSANNSSKSHHRKSKQECVKCVCICPRVTCPTCPVCPTCPKPEFSATLGSGSVPVNSGQVWRLLAIGAGGGGAGSNINLPLFSYKGGGGGRGKYELGDFTMPSDGMLTWTVGEKGIGSTDDGGNGGASQILFTPASGPSSVMVYGTGGQGGQVGGSLNGGNDGGGGGLSFATGFGTILGKGGAAGQALPGQDATPIKPGNGGDGPALPPSTALGFSFISGLPGAGGLVTSDTEGGGGAGGVGATNPDIGGEGGSKGWGAGGSGANYNPDIIYNTGGDGAIGAIGILFVR